MKKERKNNLVTVRLTGEELNTLDCLSDRLDRNRSDIMLRACKFLLAIGDVGGGNRGDSSDKDERRPHRVHVRMSEKDMDGLKKRSEETGDTISELIRKAINALADQSSGAY